MLNFIPGLSCADPVITSNLSATYPFIKWPGNVTVNFSAIRQHELTFECISFDCSHPPLLLIGEQPEIYHPDNCIQRHSTSSEEGIVILRKTLSLQDILNIYYATVNTRDDKLIQVWCDTSDHDTERGYIHLINLPPQHSMIPPTSTQSISQLPQTACNNSNTMSYNSAIVSFYHKHLLVLMLISVIGIS